MSGYMEAVVIPGGARNILVAEMYESNNYLALRNDRGEYYLNGHWFIQVSTVRAVREGASGASSRRP